MNPDLELDLDLDGGLDAVEHEVVDEKELASGFGELDIGGLDIGELDIGSVAPEADGADADDLLALAAADAEEEAADFGLLEGTDEVETRIELAKAFIDMGDAEGARDILDEVLEEGSPVQRETATALLDTLKPA